jgi:hypothetical protein
VPAFDRRGTIWNDAIRFRGAQARRVGLTQYDGFYTIRLGRQGWVIVTEATPSNATEQERAGHVPDGIRGFYPTTYALN